MTSFSFKLVHKGEVDQHILFKSGTGEEIVVDVAGIVFSDAIQESFQQQIQKLIQEGLVADQVAVLTPSTPSIAI
jgi:hypothetical protein